MKYLIETTWAVNYLRGKEEGLAISIITLAELYEGVFGSPYPDLTESHLKNFLTGISVLGMNEETCKVFGRERATLHKKGTPIGGLDLLIASTCLHYELILLTDNIKHFGMVENLKILG
jgi:Predicted nucleic acid-binding protein, contains PIN domain